MNFLNIVVPMAGRGSRFSEAGFSTPKPLIPVGGKPMIQWVIENTRPSIAHRFIFICLAEHLLRYPDVPDTLRRLAPGCEIVEVKEVTQGAACTVLLAEDLINSSDPLLIVNSDQFVDLDANYFVRQMGCEGTDGLIMTFHSSHPKWSYCRMHADGTVLEVREKEVVSNEATVGVYGFARGSDFVKAARQMIGDEERVNGEFYVAPAYNYLIRSGARILIMPTGREYNGMYGLGVPGDLAYFETTKTFQALRSDGITLSQTKVNELRGLCLHDFLRNRNLPGIEAVLSKDCKLHLPDGLVIEGLDRILQWVSQKSDQAISEEPIQGGEPSDSVHLVLEQWHDEKLAVIYCKAIP
jgi:dTDP-glucose pyrophosphorylase